MNQFLASLEITFRRDPTNYRPRVNKKHSVKDREQKGESCLLLARASTQLTRNPTASGNYFFLEE